MAECVECGEDFSNKRAELGYNTCLSCGSVQARDQAREKANRVMPLFNKGGLQYRTDGHDLKDKGK